MKSVGLLVIVSLFLCGTVYADRTIWYVHPDSAFLDTFLMAKMDTFHLPGLAASIIKDGEIIWTGTYGWARIEDSIPVTDTTSFNLGSISKTVTAVAAMQVWEQGFFGLDDDINKHLPFTVVNPYHPNDSITPRMTLIHTSSIRKNTSITGPLVVYDGDSPVPLDTFLYNYLTPSGYWYNLNNFNTTVPGTYLEYSGCGLALGGYLVPAVTVDSFQTFCQQHIFGPLGMNNTAWFYRDLDTNNVAILYHYVGGQYYLTYAYPSTPHYPAGTLKSSILDISRFLTAFMQYGELDSVRILDSTTVALMRTVQDTINSQLNQYIGITWWYYLHASTGRWCWGHAGGWVGVQAFMTFCPEENSGAIIINNGTGVPTRDILAAWLQVLLDYAAQYGIAEYESPTATIANMQVNPNPFSKLITISFNGTEEAKSVDLKIYDTTGKLVKDFRITPNARQNALSWDARDCHNRKLPSGVYFLKVSIGNYSATEKLLLIR